MGNATDSRTLASLARPVSMPVLGPPALGQWWQRAMEPWLALADASRMWEGTSGQQLANEEQDAAIARALAARPPRLDIAA